VFGQSGVHIERRFLDEGHFGTDGFPTVEGHRLIVVGSHGWGALRRLVFGSVSTALLHEAPRPVLVARHHGLTTEGSTCEKEKALA
jgi:hypothetical protein